MAIVKVFGQTVEYMGAMEEGCYPIRDCHYCGNYAEVGMVWTDKEKSLGQESDFYIGCECCAKAFTVQSTGLGHTAHLWNQLNKVMFPEEADRKKVFRAKYEWDGETWRKKEKPSSVDFETEIRDFVNEADQ